MVEIADSTALSYHEETKYTPEGVASSQHELDWSKKPDLYKGYHQARKTDLTVYVPFVEGTISEALESFPLEPLDGPPFSLEHISRLLYFTNGVTRVIPHPGAPEPMMMRAAPSAGALYPTELYVVATDVSDIEAGVYNLQVKDHSLIRVWEGDFRETLAAACPGAGDAVRAAPFSIVMTALYWRSAWRYQERAYRRILLDSGHVLGNLVLYAPRVGLRAVPVGGFVDQSIEETLLIDSSEEGGLVVIPMLPTAGGEEPRTIVPLRSACVPAELAEPELGLMRGLQRASAITGLRPHLEDVSFADATGVPAAAGDQPRGASLEQRHSFTSGRTIVPSEPVELGASLERTIITRRSTRGFEAGPITLDDLARMLDFAYGDGGPSPSGPALFDRGLLETFVIAHDIDGLETGVHYFAPRSRELRLVRSGDARGAAHRFCLGQELARDAAAVIVHTTDLWRAVTLYGERAYRYVHLDAGQIGQRLNLAALRLGLGASGIGGFFDEQVNDLLALRAREAIVYVTTLGRPQAKGTWV